MGRWRVVSRSQTTFHASFYYLFLNVDIKIKQRGGEAWKAAGLATRDYVNLAIRGAGYSVQTTGLLLMWWVQPARSDCFNTKIRFISYLASPVNYSHIHAESRDWYLQSSHCNKCKVCLTLMLYTSHCLNVIYLMVYL